MALWGNVLPYDTARSVATFVSHDAQADHDSFPTRGDRRIGRRVVGFWKDADQLDALYPRGAGGPSSPSRKLSTESSDESVTVCIGIPSIEPLVKYHSP